MDTTQFNFAAYITAGNLAGDTYEGTIAGAAAGKFNRLDLAFEDGQNLR
jgi:hypothetical protein